MRILFFENGKPANQETADYMNRETAVLTPYRVRDYQTVKNYFQFLKLFCDNIPDNVERHLIGDIATTPDNHTDLIREALMLQLGYVKPCVVRIGGKRYLAQVAKSISYEEMKQGEFQALHRDTKQWVFDTLKGQGWSEADLKNLYKDFYQ